MWITQPPKIVVKLLENLRIFRRVGKGYPEILAFLKLQKYLGNICPFEQLLYRKKSLGAPALSENFKHRVRLCSIIYLTSKIIFSPCATEKAQQMESWPEHLIATQGRFPPKYTSKHFFGYLGYSLLLGGHSFIEENK